MPQINNGKSPPWVAGEIVTAAELNGMIDSATITPSIITDQTEGTSASNVTDYLLYADTFNGVLKKINVQNIFRSGNIIETSVINGHDNGNNSLLLSSGVSFEMHCSSFGNVGEFSNTGILIKGTGVPVKISSEYGTGLGNGAGGLMFESAGYGMDFSSTNNGTVRFAQRTLFNTTGAIKLPVGTTAQRPATPVAGDTRFNSTTSSTETYNGSNWDSIASVVASSLTANGYIKLGNGLILQWATGTNANGLQVINFPIAFPNSVFCIIVSTKAENSDDNDNMFQEWSNTLSSVSVYDQTFGGAGNFNNVPRIFAIGN